jgi:hypothetical protein
VCGKRHRRHCDNSNDCKRFYFHSPLIPQKTRIQPSSRRSYLCRKSQATLTVARHLDPYSFRSGHSVVSFVAATACLAGGEQGAEQGIVLQARLIESRWGACRKTKARACETLSA